MWEMWGSGEVVGKVMNLEPNNLRLTACRLSINGTV